MSTYTEYLDEIHQALPAHVAPADFDAYLDLLEEQSRTAYRALLELAHGPEHDMLTEHDYYKYVSEEEVDMRRTSRAHLEFTRVRAHARGVAAP